MPERWLTDQQMGDLFGMSAEAARHRARRLGWRTQPNNEGWMLVLVPERAEAQPCKTEDTPDQSGVQTGDHGALAALFHTEGGA